MAEQHPSTFSLARYAPDARALVAGAQALADERHHEEVTPLHLLVRAADRDAGVVEVLRRAGAPAAELAAAAERALSALPRGREPSHLSVAMLDLLERAGREADRDRQKEIGVEQLLNALSQEIRGGAAEVLAAFGVGPGALRPHLSALREVPRSRGALAPSAATPTAAAAPGDAATVDLVAAARAGLLHPAVGRVDELRRLLTVLERRGKRHPLLVGEHGVGKGAIVQALARRLAGGDVPTTLAGVGLHELAVGALTAGARLRGEIEERVRRLLARLGESPGETILVVRSLEQLFSSGSATPSLGELLRPALERGQVRLLGTTTPDGLRRIADKDPGTVRLFTTLEVEPPSEAEAIEVVRAVAVRFERHHGVQIDEPAVLASVRLAKRYLQDRFLPDSALDLLDEASAQQRVELDGVPEAADRALSRFETLEAQLATLEHSDDPVSRVVRARLAEEHAALAPEVAAARQRLEQRRGAVAAVAALRAERSAAQRAREAAEAASDRVRAAELGAVTLPELDARLLKAEAAAAAAGATAHRVVGEPEVARTLAVWTRIPVAKMLEAEAQKLLEMEARLARRVVGQDPAVRAIARAVRRSRVGLRDPGRPIGSFLFLGPSGVGKTELAKALAEFLFDDEAALTRLDMSEFMERHMAQRLIGAPPGYADSDQGGFLTEAVRRRPWSVLLFDEVEKAHQDVFNLLLQVLDDGRLTDGRGRLADFSNTVVVMTSNIGSDKVLEAARSGAPVEGAEASVSELVQAELRRFFRPEFLNRVDDVVVFRSLDRHDLARIAELQLARVERLVAARGLRLSCTVEARDALVTAGFDPALGARPLRRAILRQVQDPLAELLLAGAVPDGATISIELAGGAVRLLASPPPPAAP